MENVNNTATTSTTQEATATPAVVKEPIKWRPIASALCNYVATIAAVTAGVLFAEMLKDKK
jgi:hypothetical protein